MKKFISCILILFILLFQFNFKVYANPVTPVLESTYNLSNASPPQVKVALYAVMAGLGVAYVGYEGYSMIDKYLQNHDIVNDIKVTIDGKIAVSKNVVKAMKDFLTQVKGKSTLPEYTMTDMKILSISSNIDKLKLLEGYSYTLPILYKNVYWNWVQPSWNNSNNGIAPDSVITKGITGFSIKTSSVYPHSMVWTFNYGDGSKTYHELSWNLSTRISSINIPLNYQSYIPTINETYRTGTKTWNPDIDKGDVIVTPRYDTADKTKTTVDGYPLPVSGSISVDNPVSIPWDTQVGVINPDGTITDADSIPSVPGTGELDLSLPDSLSLDFSPLQLSLSNKFPFCIPFDIAKSFGTFSSLGSKAPKWTLDFTNLIGGTTIDIDLSQFEKLAAITRWGILLYFNFFLITKTREYLRG